MVSPISVSSFLNWFPWFEHECATAVRQYDPYFKSLSLWETGLFEFGFLVTESTWPSLAYGFVLLGSSAQRVFHQPEQGGIRPRGTEDCCHFQGLYGRAGSLSKKYGPGRQMN